MSYSGSILTCRIDSPFDSNGKMDYDSSSTTNEKNWKALRYLHYGGGTLRKVPITKQLTNDFRFINRSLYMRLDLYIGNVKVIDIWAPCFAFEWNCQFVHRYQLPMKSSSLHKKKRILGEINSAIKKYGNCGNCDDIIIPVKLYNGYRNKINSNVIKCVIEVLKIMDVGLYLRMMSWWHCFSTRVCSFWRMKTFQIIKIVTFVKNKFIGE